jgi:UDP-glucuronate 4-epimerase
MRCLVTGSAGFIGFHVARRLLAEGHDVIGYDAFTTYYDATLKERRHAILEQRPGYRGHRALLEDKAKLEAVWAAQPIDAVIHLAAQAGVRYSLENPRAYVDANMIGTFNVLEMARQFPVKHLMLASTSSAYGANTSLPFREDDRTAHPLTLYAATKVATELMAHSYSHLWGIPTTMFRFFTVYGPWGRPDMALFKFTKGILEGQPIDIYNNGQMSRDFTYIDDLVEGIVRLMAAVPEAPGGAASPDPSLSPAAPYRIVNIGSGSPVNLMDFVEEIERAVGRKAIRNYMPMQKGDVMGTFASSDTLERLTGYRPSTPIGEGVREFVAWYRSQYGA